MMLFQHVNNTDVAIEIVKRFYVKEKKLFKMLVVWWNVVPSHPPFPIHSPARYDGAERVDIPLDIWTKEWRPWKKRQLSSKESSVLSVQQRFGQGIDTTSDTAHVDIVMWMEDETTLE